LLVAIPSGPQHPLAGPGVSANSDRPNPSAIPAAVKVKAARAAPPVATVAVATAAAAINQ